MDGGRLAGRRGGGHRAGCRTVLLAGGDPNAEVSSMPRSPLRQPDVECQAWSEVPEHLLVVAL